MHLRATVVGVLQVPLPSMLPLSLIPAVHWQPQHRRVCDQWAAW